MPVTGIRLTIKTLHSSEKERGLRHVLDIPFQGTRHIDILPRALKGTEQIVKLFWETVVYMGLTEEKEEK